MKKLFRKILKNLVKSEHYIISKEEDDFIFKVSNELFSYLKLNNIKINQTVLYIPTFYHTIFPRIIDIYIAMALLIRGVKLVPVITEDFYDRECVIWGGIYNEHRKENLKIYDLVEKKIWQKLLKTKPIYLKKNRSKKDMVRANEFINNENILNNPEFLYKNYSIYQNSINAVRNMNSIPLFENKTELIEQHKIHSKNIINLLDSYDRIFKQIKPDSVFSNFPFYYKWSVPYQVAQNYNIPFYSSLLAERKNSFFFSLNETTIFGSSAAWDSFKKMEIDIKTEQFIETVISKRSNGDVAHCSPYPKPNCNTEEYQTFLNSIDSNKPLVFFPANISFDAAVFQGSDVFTSLIDMLQKVVEFFNNNSQYQLIIKAHPGEQIFPENTYKLKTILKNLNIKLNNNIIFIDSDSKISTFDLIPLINLGIVYTSTTAMEMAWSNKPVISSALCHYNKKGFTYDPENLEEFFQILNEILLNGEDEEIKNKRVELSKKYYLFYYYYSLIDFKAFQGDECSMFTTARFLFKNYEDLLPGKNKALDYICDAIINKKPIYGENRWPPLTGECL